MRSRAAFERLRFVVLVAAGTLLAHDAVFASASGIAGMRDGAYIAAVHAYWPAFTGLVLLAATVVLGWTVAGIARLSRRLRAHPIAARADGAYLPELRRLWPRLFLATALAFLVQENVEHILAGEPAPGLFALSAPGYPLALPIIALVTGLLAAVGGWLRWRHQLLVHRLRAAGAWHRRRGTAGSGVAARWRLVGALAARGRFIGRPDAGRAPPATVSA
jgi:hypothetical protein